MMTNMAPSHGVVSGAFSPQSLDDLVSVFDKLPNQLNSGQKSKAYTNGMDRRHPLYAWASNQILPVIETTLGIKCRIHVIMYLKEFVPWTVHTDYNKGDEFPGHAFLIPIDWQGAEGSRTHTIIFNEKSKTNIEDFLSSAAPKNPNAIDLADDLCAHVDPHILECVTVAKIAAWQKGDLIYWDRELLHCSDDFLSNGIISKRALVVFCENIIDDDL